MVKKLPVEDELLDSAYIQQDPKNSSAVDILREIMHFHQTNAKEIMLDIIMRLKASDKSRGDLLAMMYKKWSESTEIVIKCAEKLAPFESPKLQSLEVNNNHTIRYVLRAPEQAESTNAWIKQVGNGHIKELTLTNYTKEEQED